MGTDENTEHEDSTMNILAKLGDAIESANHLDNESVIALGLFSPTPVVTDSRGAPAYSAYSANSHRRDRQPRNAW